MTILGILSLSIGYYISLTTDNPLSVMLLFFGAVILVIIGTYLLFTAGSVTLLKTLKKNKKYFYKPNHFISISGMIYRMKQNAVGLANICILSTMVLVMISSTLSLWIGIDDLVKQRYPREITAFTNITGQDTQSLKQTANTLLNEMNLVKTNILDYSYVEITGIQEKSSINTDKQSIYENAKASIFSNAVDDICTILVTDLEAYNQNMNTNYTLNDNEILLYAHRKAYNYYELKLLDYTFNIKEQVSDFMRYGNNAANITSGYFIVVKDQTILNDIVKSQQNTYDDYSFDMYNYYGFDLETSNENKELYYNTFIERLSTMGIQANIESKTINYGGFIAMYGGFLFIDIFLSILFIMATILIMTNKLQKVMRIKNVLKLCKRLEWIISWLKNQLTLKS